MDDYEKVDEGSFPVTSHTYPVKICNYLLSKSTFEMGHPIERGDVVFLRITGNLTNATYAFLCVDDSVNDPVFQPTVFK